MKIDYRLCKNIFLFFIIFALSFNTFASEDVKLKTFVNKAKLTSDESIVFNIQVIYPKSIRVFIPSMGSNFEGLRLQETDKKVEQLEDNLIKEVHWYELEADISGSYILPAVEITYQDQMNNTKNLKTGEIFVEVVAPDFNSEKYNKKLIDIKPIYEKSYLSFYVVIFLCILVIGLLVWYFLFFRKKKIKEVVIPAHEKALNSLNQLKSENSFENVDFKVFYFKISEILRDYLEQIYPISASDMTFEEIRKNLKINSVVNENSRKNLLMILEKSDYIKFTDFKPNETLHNNLIKTSYDFIEQTKPTVEDDEIEDSVL